MAELSTENLESVLRLIAGAGPGPWYPKVHAESSGVDRDSLDAPLEKLRLAGMVRLTDWVKDHGQGYVLTPEGMTALNDVWTLDVSSMTKMKWQKIETTGRKPDARGYHTANLVGNVMIVVGGSNGKELFTDIWCLHLGA